MKYLSVAPWLPLAIATTLLIPSAASAQKLKGTKPNIILIITDCRHLDVLQHTVRPYHQDAPFCPFAPYCVLYSLSSALSGSNCASLLPGWF